MSLIPPPLWIDTHCHLDANEFAQTRQQIVAAALACGISQMVVPAITAQQFANTLAMRQQYGCLIAFGLHPMYCSLHLDDHLTQLTTWVTQEEPIAIGEIGLDAWLPDTDLARQEALFIEQLKLARHYELPVILHLRRAQDRVLKYLRQIPVIGGIAHAFNGSQQQAEAFIRLGFKLGFGGALTYNGSQRIRKLAATLPFDSLVLETDAPDMRPSWAPEKPNQPANLPRFAAELAQLRNTTLAAIAQQTTANALQALQLDEHTLGRLHLTDPASGP